MRKKEVVVKVVENKEFVVEVVKYKGNDTRNDQVCERAAATIIQILLLNLLI